MVMMLRTSHHASVMTVVFSPLPAHCTSLIPTATVALTEVGWGSANLPPPLHAVRCQLQVGDG